MDWGFECQKDALTVVGQMMTMQNTAKAVAMNSRSTGIIRRTEHVL